MSRIPGRGGGGGKKYSPPGKKMDQPMDCSTLLCWVRAKTNWNMTANIHAPLSRIESLSDWYSLLSYPVRHASLWSCLLSNAWCIVPKQACLMYRTQQGMPYLSYPIRHALHYISPSVLFLLEQRLPWTGFEECPRQTDLNPHKTAVPFWRQKNYQVLGNLSDLSPKNWTLLRF